MNAKRASEYWREVAKAEEKRNEALTWEIGELKSEIAMLYADARLIRMVERKSTQV